MVKRNKELTSRPRHGICAFPITVIRAGDHVHCPGIISHHDKLASDRVQGLVLYTAQRQRRQPRTVDDNIGLLSGMVSVGSICNVADDGPLEHYAGLPALAQQPGQVYSRVDADGCEVVGTVDTGV